MKMIVLSIFDTQVEAFMRPFFAQTEGQAVRMFYDEVKAQNSPMGAHPEDYALFRIGTFQDSNALIEPETPKRIALAIEANGNSENA